jgi:hypothetical protein
MQSINQVFLSYQPPSLPCRQRQRPHSFRARLEKEALLLFLTLAGEARAKLITKVRPSDEALRGKQHLRH